MTRVKFLLPARRRAAALAALTGCLAGAALPPVASADTKTPIDITVQDRTGDVWHGGPSGLDIVGATVHQDRVAATVSATVTYADAPGAMQADTRVMLGFADTTGSCKVEGAGSAHITISHASATAKYVVATSIDVSGEATVTTDGNTVTVVTAAAPHVFDLNGWRCAYIATGPPGFNNEAESYDTAIGFALDDAPAPPAAVAVAAPKPGGPAPILDADNDGIRDGVDSCPQVPGAGTNGCETTPAAKAVVLGTKRVVIDTLLALTGDKCPAAVKVTVTLKGKRMAAQLIGTTLHGKFCQAVGIVKLKKKIAKARVVLKGTGVTPVAATVKR